MREPFLSRAAATVLRMIARLDDVSLDTNKAIKQEFPKLCTKGQKGAKSHRATGCYFKSGAAHSMVCAHSGHAQTCTSR